MLKFPSRDCRCAGLVAAGSSGRRLAVSLSVLWGLLAGPAGLSADTFIYRDRDGQTVEVAARLVASAQGAHVLETRDGQYRLVPEAAVLKRMPGPDPKPVTADEMVQILQQQFGAEQFRAQVQQPFVLGMVLAAPLAKNHESRVTNFLRKAGAFMKNVELAFGTFIKELRINSRQPVFPLVVLIFEADEDFEKYAREVTGERGLSAGVISGFYNKMTNFLAIRMSECRTFDVPLHEAIHQQVYNRNVFQRFAPVPHWFDEGIATGFEANEGKISIGPTKISPRYARQALGATTVSWSRLLQDDSVFAGDILAGEAYGHAWGVHWLLVSKYRAQYAKYVRLLSEKEPLAKEPPEQRRADFKEAIGKDISELEKEFVTTLQTGVRRQGIDLKPQKPPGISLTHENLAEVQLTAVKRLDQGGRLEVQGKLTNTSPIRPLAYHVTVETEIGTYTDWLIPELDVAKSSPLVTQHVNKVMKNARPFGQSQTFRVRVVSTLAKSPVAERWQKGDLPVPEFAK